MNNYFNYFTEIEEYFLRRRGKNVLVSPLDWCLIELWKASGIPPHVVLRGIDRSFETAEKRQKKPPSNLFYCQPAVLEAFEEYERAKLGSENHLPGQAPFTREQVLAYLQKCRTGLLHLKGELFESATQRLMALCEEVSRSAFPDYERLDRDLSTIGAEVTRELGARLPEEVRKKIRQEITEDVKIYRKRVSKEVYRRLQESYLAKKIRQLYNLEEFSLFSLTAPD
ncbi:MAG: hypothetical protein HY645_07205 [Acidobacteria bacterium]|nr:hypothetical protein [Acidobacteriota bacterium]